jgi:hypothetical protein
MMIYFEDCTDHLVFTKPKRAFSMIVSRYHVNDKPKNEYDRYHPSWTDTESSEIFNYIKENFTSMRSFDIDSKNTKDYAAPFYFEDGADESAFILWSSNVFYYDKSF